MESLPGPQQDDVLPCDACGNLWEELDNHGGDNMCANCVALFWAARILFEESIVEEDQVIPTLALGMSGHFNRLAEERMKPEQLAQELFSKYPGLEISSVVAGVPIVKVKPAVVETVQYVGTSLAKEVRIEVFSRHAKPKYIADEYGRALKQANIPWDQCSHGRVGWSFEDAHLIITVDTGEEVHRQRALRLSENPHLPRPSFPPPGVLESIYGTVLGSADSRKPRGYAGGLDHYGKSSGKSAAKAIPACVAWHLGGHRNGLIPVEDRSRVARLINRHVIGDGKQQLFAEEGYENTRDNLWRDAVSVASRLLRLLYIFQESSAAEFRQRLARRRHH